MKKVIVKSLIYFCCSAILLSFIGTSLSYYETRVCLFGSWSAFDEFNHSATGFWVYSLKDGMLDGGSMNEPKEIRKYLTSNIPGEFPIPFYSTSIFGIVNFSAANADYILVNQQIGPTSFVAYDSDSEVLYFSSRGEVRGTIKK